MDKGREQYVHRHIARLAQEVFPDDVGIKWRILGFEHKQGLCVVEIAPPPQAMGYDKFKFVISFENTKSPLVLATYAFEQDRYFLLSAVQGYKDPLPKAASTPAQVAPRTTVSAGRAGSRKSKVGIWFEGFSASLSSLVLAALLLVAWVDPLSIEGGSWVRLVVGILCLEFIMVHSGVFMGAIALGEKKGVWLIGGGVILFYAVFAIVITIAFDSWYFLFVYSAIMFSRWQGMFRDGRDFFNESLARTGVSIVNLLFTALLVAIFPVPRLGITDRVLAMNPIKAEGQWIDNPEYALATGVIYFSLMAVFEWLAMRYRLRAVSPKRRAVVPA